MAARRSLLLGLPLAATLLVATLARAALVAIDPVKVLLTSAQRSKTINLRNNGTEKLRFQLSAFDWQQSALGEMQLAPTTDVVFYPSLLELLPGETRRVRVTSDAQPSSSERNYRLFIDELPSLGGAPGGAVRVLTRFGLPVFLQPDAPKPAPKLRAEVRAGKLFLTLSNGGNAHFVAQSVRVVGRSSDGSAVLQDDLPGWYVLAFGRRIYEVSPPKDICEKLARVSVNANTDHGAARTDYQVPIGACRAP